MFRFIKFIAIVGVLFLGISVFNDMKFSSKGLISNNTEIKETTKANKSKTNNSVKLDGTKKNKTTNNAVGDKAKKSDNDYSILVSSNDYNAVVSLDGDTKKLDVKEVGKDLDKVVSDNYINLSDKDLKYLEEHKDEILNSFKDGSLMDKYNLVNDMLSKYDNDISKTDLINIAVKYLK
ncbi:hypothetical protein [Romboutsia lituseburensis]|uniref:hypothetical protein n=1 Tax=Romboutsia lituseburensis TaxID=1537 RepID=UPI00215A3583|nr:hypothetical protein [Romboutsia lituseburensis]MCR8746878.1 hypothetical protein [Romboutsia lituseburensis]